MGTTEAKMRSYLLLCLSFAVCCYPATVRAESPADMISNFRAQHGERRVTSDPKLTRIAHQQATAMAAGRAAENIAYGYDSFAKTLNQWIDSAGHRKNLLLHNASRVGVASAKSATTGRTYWAMEIAGDYERPKTMASSKQSVSAKPKARASQACRLKILSLCL